MTSVTWHDESSKEYWGRSGFIPRCFRSDREPGTDAKPAAPSRRKAAPTYKPANVFVNSDVLSPILPCWKESDRGSPLDFGFPAIVRDASGG